jgi:anti-sigma regulatory factor (Ser/Thr protein kinase)
VNTATAPGYRHHALLYDSPAQLMDAAVPFLAEGLAADELAVLSCRAEHNAQLVAALGGHEHILTLAHEDIYLRIAHAVATYRRLVQQQVAAGAPRVRLVGEVRFGNSPDSWTEWTHFEAICNVALGPLPLSSVCAYDTRELPAPMRRGVEQTHPALLTAGGRVTNDRYTPPEAVLRRTPRHTPEPLPATPRMLHVATLTHAGQLADIRAQLGLVLSGTPRHERLRADFVIATAEVLTNALQHGRPPVDLRLWTTPTRLVCDVTDHGEGFDDPLAGYVPYGDDLARAGLWLARQCCDTLDFFTTPRGFTAQLTTHLPAPEHR